MRHLRPVTDYLYKIIFKPSSSNAMESLLNEYNQENTGEDQKIKLIENQEIEEDQKVTPEENTQSTSLLLTNICKKIQNKVNFQLSADNQKLIFQCALNFLRDFFWAKATFEVIGPDFKITTDIHKEWKGQQIIGTAASAVGLVIISVCIYLKKRCKNTPDQFNQLIISNSEKDSNLEEEFKTFFNNIVSDETNNALAKRSQISIQIAESHLSSGVDLTSSADNQLSLSLPVQIASKHLVGYGIIYFLAAISSLTIWNEAQVFGYRQGKGWGWEDYSAWLFASLPAGVSEGLMQYGTICFLELLSQVWVGSITRQNVYERLKMIPKEILYSGTMGAIPGAVWNISYTLAVKYNFSDNQTASTVAVATGLANLASGKLSQRVFGA